MDDLTHKIEQYIEEERFEDCFNFLKDKLDKSEPTEADGLLIALIRLNDLFTVTRKEDIYDLYVRYKHKLQKHDLFNIIIWLHPLRIYSFYYELAYNNDAWFGSKVPEYTDGSKGLLLAFNPPNIVRHPDQPIISFADIDITAFQFTIPYNLNIPGWNETEDRGISIYEESTGIKTEFFRISHFTKHPFYKVHRTTIIAGSTLGHMFDIYPGLKDMTLVQITIPEAFHPEFTFKEEGGILKKVDIDLSDDYAVYGEGYIPSKVRIIQEFRRLVTQQPQLFPFAAKDVTIDFFSFFKVLYFNASTKGMLLERWYFFTSDNIYKKFTADYTDRLNQLGVLDTSFINKFKNFTLHKESDLHDFVTFMFAEAAHQINHKSGYKYLWHDPACELKPKNEPGVQPYILNIIEPLCELKGVSVVREPTSSEGEIDMLFTYTNTQGALLKVCVEAKKAHHAQISTAVNSQLKRYLDSQHTKFGVYLVLWFKYPSGDGATKFNEPKKYATPDELKLSIESNKPDEYHIDTIIIDCTKPKSPSIKSPSIK